MLIRVQNPVEDLKDLVVVEQVYVGKDLVSTQIAELLQEPGQGEVVPDAELRARTAVQPDQLRCEGRLRTVLEDIGVGTLAGWMVVVGVLEDDPEKDPVV